MKIVPIFVSGFPAEDALFFAMEYEEKSYKGKNVLDYLFDLWEDASYLRNFFTERKHDLADPFWKEISINDAVRQVAKEAQDFYNALDDIEQLDLKHRTRSLHELFELLHKYEQGTGPYSYKARTEKPRGRQMLRLYAIKLIDGRIIITGGGIKLTRSMQEDGELEKELERIEKVKAFLKRNNIEYLEDYFAN